MPAWTDSAAYKLLHSKAIAELKLDSGQYYYEDPSGNRKDTKASSIYFALGRGSDLTAVDFTSALNQLTTV